MFGLKLKAQAKAQTQDVSVTKQDRTILIYVSATGYQIDLGNDQEPLAGGVNFDPKASAVDRVEAAVEAAISSVPSRALRGSDQIGLIVDGALTKFLDARQSNLASATPERRREFGARLFGASGSSFGDAPLTDQDRKNDRPGVFGFIEQQALQRILAATGEHCVKLTQVVPSAALAVARSATSHLETYGGLYFGALETSVVLVNRTQGMVLIRHVPVGLRTLVNAVAEKASLSEKDIIAGFAKRNYFQDLESARGRIGEGTTATSVSLGPIEDALLPNMRTLIEEIENTINFFEEQRGGERPAQLELMGEFAELRGFRTYLTNVLGLPVPRVDSSVFDLVLSTDKQDLINLLAGLEGSPITIGKSRYALRDHRLVKSTAAPKKATSAKNRANTGASGGTSSSVTRSRRRQPPPEAGGFFEKLGIGKKKDQAVVESGGDEKDETAAYMFVFFTILAAFLYFGWTQVSALNKQVQRYAVGYHEAVKDRDELRADLGKLGVNPIKVKVQQSTELDKVLWTEKFLAIGEHMTAALWVTDVYLEAEQKSISDLEVLSSRLVIEGAALPSSDGHIAEIANYIDRLERDQARFMSDFYSLSFEGSRVDETESDEVVRFTIAAHYDQNKRIEAKKTRRSGGSGSQEEGEEGPGGLENMQNSIDDRQETLESLIPGVRP